MLIESRPRLRGAAMSVSDRTLDALIDHLQDSDLPTILARLTDRSEPYSACRVCVCMSVCHYLSVCLSV